MSAHQRRAWGEAEDQRLLRMYSEGYPRSVIAEALGRPGKTVYERKRKLLDEACPTS